MTVVWLLPGKYAKYAVRAIYFSHVCKWYNFFLFVLFYYYYRKRSHGGQKKRYNDILKASLKDFSIPTKSWEQIAQDRAKWQGLIKRGGGEYEAKRISEAEQKRAQRKARAKASPTALSSSDLSCSICNRQFRAKIGLISHLRTHK